MDDGLTYQQAIDKMKNKLGVPEADLQNVVSQLKIDHYIKSIVIAAIAAFICIAVVCYLHKLFKESILDWIMASLIPGTAGMIAMIIILLDSIELIQWIVDPNNKFVELVNTFGR